MKPLANIRTFNTPNFIVRVDAEEEIDLDLSFDETGEVATKLEHGEYVAFCAHATVTHRATGGVLGEAYLGNCIYNSYAEFADHVACGIQNRAYEAAGTTGRCGSYFAQMIEEAIEDARGALRALQAVKVRA